MEDLKKIKRNTSKTKEGYKRTRHNNAISQVPFYMFKEILTNKATLYGKKVESVSPTYTSQTDSRTGKRDGERRGCRYVCTDNVVLDADWNAAVNIAERGLHPYTKKTPLDGALNFLCGRAQSIAHMYDCC
jgi:IS605 OrfB family transposase